MARARVIALLAVLLLVSACAGDDGGSGGSGSTSTTVDAVTAAQAFTEPGPHPVGVATLELPEGGAVEVWYPAVEGTTGTVAYDVRAFVPEAIRAILTADVPATYEIVGARDAAVADGTFPVVLFSHGFTGFRTQSSFLTSHLASWGTIVVAPDHPSRDLRNVLGGTASGEASDSAEELLGSLDLIVAEGERAGSPFEGHVDGGRTAAVGHSAGGGTIVAAADDERVDGYVAMASGQRDEAEGLPDRPSFFLAGASDGVVPPERTTTAHEAAPSPSLLWLIDAVGHNGFADLCTFGGGTGIIGVAEASGLGGLLDAQPQLRSLGEDGCIPPAAPVEEAHDVIRHGATAWLLELFGEVEDPAGLTSIPAGAYDLSVTIDEH